MGLQAGLLGAHVKQGVGAVGQAVHGDAVDRPVVPVRQPRRERRVGVTACPGHRFLAVKRPVRRYKSAIENRFTMETAEGA